MTAWDCRQIFSLYDHLLLFYEPGEAREWLITERKDLNDRRPCELIESPAGIHRVWACVRALPEELDCE